MNKYFLFGLMAAILTVQNCKKTNDGPEEASAPEKFYAPSAARIAQLPGQQVSSGFVVSDPKSRKIRIYNAAGELINSFFVKGSPLAVAIMDSGEILVGDAQYRRIDKYSTSGEYMETICSGIKMPGDMAIYQKENKVFVTDGKDNSVKECSLAPNMPNSEAIVFVSNFSSGDSFNFPSGIAVDESNNKILVSDFMNKRVVIFGADGTVLKIITKTVYPQMDRPQGITIDQDGYIYVTDVLMNMVLVFDTNGDFQTFIGEYGSQAGQLRIPMDVIVTPDQSILVTNGLNKRIEVY